MKNIFIYIIVFLYIYPIQFTFLPVSTRFLFAIFGFAWYIVIFLLKRNFFTIHRFFFNFLLLLFSIAFVALVSILYNITYDFEYVKYVISMIIIIFASYFIINCLKELKYRMNFFTISILIINVVLIQSIIAFIMFLIPDFRDILLNIQKLSPEEIELVTIVNEFRMIGFGATFFGAGIVSGFALILIAKLIRLNQFSLKKILILSLKFLFIFVIGMIMSRTTLIGFFLAILLVLLPEKFDNTINMFQKRGLFFLSIIIIPLIITILFLTFFSSLYLIFNTYFEYGFELFINFFENGSFESSSTNELATMYIFPTDIKTFIIGDGYFMDPMEKSLFYMHTDVGYIRFIYYFGFIGLLLYLIMQIYLIVLAYKKLGISIGFYFFIILYLLILNLKGITDLLFLNVIFLMAYLINKRKGIND